MLRFLWIPFLVGSVSYGKTVPLSRAQVEKKQEALKSISYLSVDFRQTVFRPLRKRKINYYGVAKFAQPQRILWEKKRPIPETILWDGSTLIIYKPNEKKADKFNARGSQAREFRSLTAMILDMKALLRRFGFVSAEHDQEKDILYLNLKGGKGEEIASVSAKISLNKNYIEQVKLTYADQGVYTYEFSNPSFAKLEDKTFEFAPPASVKVRTYD